MSSEQSRFVDEYFNVHERGTELGRGGQGVVFRTTDPDVAVKLALDGNGRPVTHAGYVEKLRRVRALPVPPGLHLAAPMAVLRERAGYAMRLLNHMVPFAHFWPDPSRRRAKPTELPRWLSSVPEELAFSLVWYRDSGGLHRRLVALYKSASILARLHGAGLVYGDVSPANVFISKEPRSREVWLIDADNLRYETPGAGPGIYTERFGAPELVQGHDGSRQRTDCHAFAVMAFSMLTLLHPFIGDLVESGNEGDWAAEDADATDLDERAYAGRLPWILDDDDRRNRKDNGLVGLALTDELMSLFQATFGPGRTKPWMRPSMFRWPSALARASDEAVICAGCSMSYSFDFEEASQCCPFCSDARAPTFVATAYRWEGGPVVGQAPVWRFARDWSSASPNPVLPHRLLYPFSVGDGDRDILELRQQNDELRLTFCDGGRSHRVAIAADHEGDDAFVEFEGTSAIPLSLAAKGFWIRVGGAHSRVLRCVLQGGAS